MSEINRYFISHTGMMSLMMESWHRSTVNIKGAQNPHLGQHSKVVFIYYLSLGSNPNYC